MTSVGCLANEVKPSTTRLLLSPAPLEGPLATNPIIGKSMSDTPSCVASESAQESPRGKFADAMSNVVLAPSFTYNVCPSSNVSPARNFLFLFVSVCYNLCIFSVLY